MMSKMWLASILASVNVLVAAGAEPQAGRPAPAKREAAATLPVLGPGLHTATLERAGAPPIRYTISVPEGPAPAGGAPLVLALHYGGEVTPFYGKDIVESLVEPALRDLKAVIVAPDSQAGAWDSPANARAVPLLIESVAASYKTDRKKLVVTGFSMGGEGSWSFAGKYPGRFAAAVPVAGEPPTSLAGWRTPVFAVHGSKDEIMSLAATRKGIEALQAAKVDARLVVLDGLTHYQTEKYVAGLRQAVPWLQAILK